MSKDTSLRTLFLFFQPAVTQFLADLGKFSAKQALLGPDKAEAVAGREVSQVQLPQRPLLQVFCDRGLVEEADPTVGLHQFNDGVHVLQLDEVGKIAQSKILLLQAPLQDISGA